MTTVAIVKDKGLAYPRKAPFHPGQDYPEYPFRQPGEYNGVYEAVRQLLISLGLDREHYGTTAWNPLGGVVQPGQTVLLKPNFITHWNPVGDVDCLFTHGSVVRAILDYVHIALRGEGRIIIGDAPVQRGNFEKLVEINGINEIVDFYGRYAKLHIDLIDLRLVTAAIDDFRFLTRQQQEGDRSGYAAIDLKQDSELSELDSQYERFRVTNYDKKAMTRHHNRAKHEYLISNSALSSDVIINIPKLKTHRKAGMTCALKNMVGLNGSKDWLPHHRYGSTQEGGDEYLHKSVRKRVATRLHEMKDVSTSRTQARLLTILLGLLAKSQWIIPHKDPYREGSWYGNDTLPRTITDLNRIAFYADKQGVMRDTVQRQMMVLVDGIVGGEREGPLDPSPKQCGVLVLGRNPVAVDLVCSRIMGFDYRKIPQFRYAMSAAQYGLFQGQPQDIVIRSAVCGRFDELPKAFDAGFIASQGWTGHVEDRANEEWAS